MEEQDLNTLKYPIGKFAKPLPITMDMISGYIDDIESFPGRLKNEVSKLSDEQLDLCYRPGGWTVRQVVHHCADSHMNSFIRFKLTLTEQTPTVKPYIENQWSELPDAKLTPPEFSLLLLEGLHKRWVVLLRSLTESDFQMSFYHPEQKREIELDEITALYAWHCNHHLAHVKLVSCR